MMDLSEWCEQVPHGQYFQPIRLTLVGVDAQDKWEEDPATLKTSGVNAAEQEPPAEELNPAEPQTSSASPDKASTQKRLKQRKKDSKAQPAVVSSEKSQTVERDDGSVVFIPPFQSVSIGGNHTALNAGGPVWAMDWLPQPSHADTTTVPESVPATKKGKASKENNTRKAGASSDNSSHRAQDNSAMSTWRLLALSTHPPCKVVDDKMVKVTPPDHYFDLPESGRGLVQIWAIPIQSASTDKSAEATQPRRLPRLVYAIDHHSGVAWDMQWCPLVHKFPRSSNIHDKQLLGVLAVCFGDGSLQVFEVPTVPAEKLAAEPKEDVVGRLQPILQGKVDSVIQLTVRWSPHHWNLMLTGSSDGSVALWNLQEVYGSSRNTESDQRQRNELEPQRRFQDADTVGKQEAFDWGWGWVAIRAVCWSPYDENLFVTTGNDSMFKVWDIREPRISFRSHRIRSTWGLALQWLDDTSVHISGDQGSIYMYDILSGSYQKLHFHPQIDSPVWDMQLARRAALPLLISSCAAGSVRLAPAKKLFRAPQYSIEICRLHGEKDANVEQPHKALTLDFTRRIVSVSAEAISPATREFCERDASLHRLRVSTFMANEFPCYVATGGHAGLIIIMEMQNELDQVMDKHFIASNKKIGRPRKSQASSTKKGWNLSQIGQAKPKKAKTEAKAKRSSGGVKLSSFVKAKKMHTAISKYKPKQSMKAEPIESEAEADSPSEPEYQEEEEESESGSEELSLADDNSDDDHARESDDDFDTDSDHVDSPQTAADARMRSEYQLDLSEEDAILLAIQMSEMEQRRSLEAQKTSRKSTDNGAATKKSTKATSSTPASRSKSKSSDNAAVESTRLEKKITSSAGKSKKTPLRSSGRGSKTNTPNGTSSGGVPSTSASKQSAKSKKRAPKDESSISPMVASAAADDGDDSKSRLQATKVPSGASESQEAKVGEEMDQTSIQMLIYQKGMSEEDALREAIRMSEVGHMRRSNRKRKAPTPDRDGEVDLEMTAKPVPSKRTTVSKRSPEQIVLVAVSENEEVTRRLEFGRDGGASQPATPEQVVVAPPAISSDVKLPAPKHMTPPKSSAASKSSGKKPAARTSTTKKAKKASYSEKPSEPSADSVEPELTSSFSTPTAQKKATKRPSTSSKSRTSTPSTSSRKRAKSTKRSDNSLADLELSEEELLALALQTSQIEY
ncbi:hypothetical protein Poli38472_011610 [Pythium oligandrum]|uniref:Uncharacterized protein n=1 Tax=Pythium oligandrum TaxID=41045 RepID=A0A8K1CL98_PYTOL|nr:hypothetical protein Poli38472_011610 [Pythium oligandrum]|eukprot:TMW64730.1 hypothetical protein Poli38472_011610 [Pythium oligandrum]